MSSKVKIITGSTRQGRSGKAIADRLIEVAKQAGHELENVDLQDLDLDFYDSAVPPAMAPVQDEKVNKWREVVESADGLVIVTAEYNRSIPAPLKNAVDFLGPEWEGKKVLIVSYGMVDGGMNVAKHLHDVFDWLKADTLENDVHVKMSRSHFNENHEFVGVNDAVAESEKEFLEGLEKIKTKEGSHV